jgi:ATP-dependent helicase/nuclease subunit B
VGNVRFILGRPGSGKTTTIINEIAALHTTEPLGDPIFLLVPDQATLLYERLVARAIEAGGYLRVEVITFRQLVDRLLRESGGSAIPEVTPLGRRILIGRLLRRLQPQLKFYRSTARQPGLADRLDDAFAEIEHAGLSGEDLERIALDVASSSPDSALPAKLRDLRLLTTEYDRVLGTERLDQHRRLAQALEAAAHSTSLPRARLYVDGFDEFTRTERRLIARVALAGCATTVAFAMDADDAKPAREAAPLPDDHPFRAATHAYRRLARVLREDRHAPTIVALDRQPRFRTDGLIFLARHFFTPRPGKIDAGGDVRFLEAPTRRAEADAAARQILDWLREGLRLRDILVLARDVSQYAADIEASFGEHSIAHFVDRQQPASHHPLVRTVRSLVQVALTDWRSDAVVELAKAGLAGLDDDVCDALENYLLAHRIRGGDAWRQSWAFRSQHEEEDEVAQFATEDLDRVNAVRERFRTSLEPLSSCDDGVQCSAAQWCQRICESLDRLGINVALAALIKRCEDAGDVAEADRHREVWTALSELLDQLAEVLGDEPLSLRELSEVIDVSFERFVFTVAPPTLDQVLVGSVDRTRSGPVRACIVLGLSEGLFPVRRDEGRGALADDDRKSLESLSVDLKPGTRTALFDEQLFAYQAFTAASEKLVISRPLRDEGEAGRRLSPSIFWTQAIALFRDAPVEPLISAPRGACIATAHDLVLATLHWARDPAAREKDGLSAVELSAYATASTLPAVVRLRWAVARAEAYRNDAALSASVAAALYPSPLKTSATRLETFAACPFKHFAQHALRLSPRNERRLTPLDLGTVYHRVLDRLVRRAISDRHDLARPLPDLSARIGELGEEAAADLRAELLLSPGRHAHLVDGVRQTLEDVIETQRLALAMGSFRPASTEFPFGLDAEDGTPPLVITTPRGRSVALRGKIDRVDTIEIADQLAATVIDYKLGKRQAKFEEIHFGISLQLVTYLLVLSAIGKHASGKDVSPAAAFYVRLLRQIESVAHPDDATPVDTDEFHLTLPNKPRGVIDAQFAGELDRVTTEGSTSKAYALKVSQVPIETKRADVLDHPTFAALIEWTRRKIGQIADRIIDGEVRVRPYRLRTLTPCSTCSYRSVCRFELPINRYQFVDTDKGKRLNWITAEVNQ